MADSGDFARAMAQWQASLPTANKPTMVLGMIPDINFQQLSAAAASPKIMDSKVVRAGRGRKPSEFLAALGLTADKLREGFTQANNAAPPTQGNILTSGDSSFVGSGLPRQLTSSAGDGPMVG